MLGVYSVELKLEVLVKYNTLFKKGKMKRFEVDGIYFYTISESAESLDYVQLEGSKLRKKIDMELCAHHYFDLPRSAELEIVEKSRTIKEVFPTINEILSDFTYKKACELLKERGIKL